MYNCTYNVLLNVSQSLRLPSKQLSRNFHWGVTDPANCQHYPINAQKDKIHIIVSKFKHANDNVVCSSFLGQREFWVTEPSEVLSSVELSFITCTTLETLACHPGAVLKGRAWEMSKEATGSRGPVLSRPCFCLECVFVCTPSAKEGCNIPGNTLERLFEKHDTFYCTGTYFVRSS